MSVKLSPYPKYKDSGLEWLRRIPAHWDIQRMKCSVKNIVDQTNSRNADEVYIALEHVESWTGRITPAGEDAAFESSVKRFQPDDVLFGKLRPYLAKVVRPNQRGVCVGEFFVLRSRSTEISPPYLEHLLRSSVFIDLVNSSTFGAKMPRADWGFVGNACIVLPSVDEQQKIACYLDRLHALTERLVRTKRRLISLLEEQKQVVIQTAVTCGLDPDAPMKSTGLDWLPEVPEHWSVWRLSHLAKIGNGSTPSRGNPAYWSNGDYPWLNSSVVNQQRVYESDQFVTATALRECHLPLVYPGSILVAITGQGKTRGMAAILETEATINQHLAYIAPRSKRVSTEFLHVSLTGAYAQLRAISDASGSTKGALTCEDLKRFRIALPSPEEQKIIAARIAQELSTIDKAIRRARSEIDLIGEYRTRLISDVVTGKLDVRGVELPEVEEIEGVSGIEETLPPILDDFVEEPHTAP